MDRLREAAEELVVALHLAELLAGNEEAGNVAETAAVCVEVADGVECGARGGADEKVKVVL